MSGGGVVRAPGWAASALIAAALLWGGAGYLATKPTDFHDYRVAAVGAARSAYDALATAELTGRAVLAHRVTGPYAASTLDDCRSALAGAAKRFAGVGPPDAPTRAMRDELGPLLVRANAALSGVEDGVSASSVAALHPVAARLDDFVQAHQ
jgi:hypothetical protein